MNLTLVPSLTIAPGKRFTQPLKRGRAKYTDRFKRSDF